MSTFDYVPAEFFLALGGNTQQLKDSIRTAVDFEKFCRALNMPAIQKLNISKHPEVNHIDLALGWWFNRDPTVADLCAVLKICERETLIEKLGLEEVNPALATSVPYTPTFIEVMESVKVRQPIVRSPVVARDRPLIPEPISPAPFAAACSAFSTLHFTPISSELLRKPELKRSFLEGAESGTVFVTLDDPILFPLFEVVQDCSSMRSLSGRRIGYGCVGFDYIDNLKVYQVEKFQLENAYDRMDLLLQRYETKKANMSPHDPLWFTDDGKDNFRIDEFGSHGGLMDALERRVDMDRAVFQELQLPNEFKRPFQYRGALIAALMIPKILVLRALETLDQRETFRRERIWATPEPLVISAYSHANTSTTSIAANSVGQKRVHEQPPDTAIESVKRVSPSAQDDVRIPKSEETATKREDALECVICMEAARAVAFMPCGHYCCCEVCCKTVKSCPTCRKEIDGTIKIFVS